MNKKIIIIGIGGIVVITGAIVIPIVVIGNNNNNEEKNKEDVEAIIKILKSKPSSQKTLILKGNSTGKIISNNKEKIITKIKKLIGFEKLRGVKFDVSLENDVDISTTEKFIIVIVKKEKHSQQLKGENGLKVKRAKNVQEIKIDTIKEYLNNLDNLNLTLPKTNYSTDNEILVAIRKLLATQINNIEIDDINLITKKESSSEIVSVATHNNEETTPYEITVNDEDFTLKLKQEEFSEDEKNVKNIKQSLESLTLKEITIDASSGSINNNKNSILEKIQTLSGYPSDLKGVSLSIKNSSDLITLEGIAFTILLSKDSVINEELRGFIVKRSQSQAEIDQNDIDEIKVLLNVLNLKEVTIDESNGSITTNKNSILEKVQALSGYPSDLKGVSLSIKDSSDLITLEGVAFTIWLSKGSVINQELRGFIVKRSQSQVEIDQNDVNEVKRLLNALNLKELTIDASSGSITTNKNSILRKLQALSGYPSDLKGVIVSIKEEETEINLEEVAFIIELSKGSVVNQELRGFTVKRSQTPTEKIKNNIKEYLKISINLNIFLPKDTGSDYDENSKILAAIRKKLEIFKPLDFSKNDFDNLINKKQPPTPNTEVAAHDASTPTPYIITIDGEDFTLQLKQNQYTSGEEKNTIINSIKTYLENEDNLDIILPKDTNSNYDEDSKILIAIKIKLIDSISDFKNYDANLIVKEGLVPITEVATHDAINPTEYKIIVGGEQFTLRLKQDQFTKSEKTKINAIKTYLETGDNLNLILPQTTYSDDNSVLEAIKLKLINDIEDISSIDSHLIVKKVGSVVVTLVAVHGQPSTQYIIVVGENSFTLKLNQEEFSKQEKTKINAIKTYLETGDNLNLILPQTTYSDDNSVLEAIKLKLINDIEDISSIDSHLIVKKVGSVVVTLVAVHGQPSTQYIIVVGENEFTLNLNQDQFIESEKIKINAIKTYLENLDNFNLILPKKTYSNDNSVLEAIKLKLENDIKDISSSDYHLITKKGSISVTQVATHNSPTPTSYEITIGKHEFTLKLKQEKFDEEEKTKIINIKDWLNTLDNLNIILPKNTGSDYDEDSKVLMAIKKVFVDNISSINDDDFDNLITKKQSSSSIASVANHDSPIPTLYIITIDEIDYNLQLKQTQITEEQKNNAIKEYLKKFGKFYKFTLPKITYSNDDSILNAIRVKLVNDINEITTNDFYLINKKINSKIMNDGDVRPYKLPPIGEKYIITIDGEDFALNPFKEEFSKEEKRKISVIKTYLETPTNLNLILPKITYGDIYNRVIDVVKLKLVNDIEGISSSDLHLIKREASQMFITSFASYGEAPTPYEIKVGNEHKFTLNLNKDEFTKEQKNDAIKNYLENMNTNNLNFILPKTTYNNDNDILNAIKEEFVTKLNEFTTRDYDLITKKVGSSVVTSVVTYNVPTSTSYTITIDGEDFTLQLKQSQFTKK